MRRYCTIGEQNAPATPGSGQNDASVVGLISSTAVKPHVYELIVGSPATPADQAFGLKMSRLTAVGTWTTVTPVKLDPGDPAASASGRSNSTAAPTYTASSEVLSVALNQQATFRWVTPPEEGIILPATANNGVGLYFDSVSGGTALLEASLYHSE